MVRVFASLLIMVRRIGSIRLQIWQIILLGAIAVLLTGKITPLSTLNTINLGVILFLFGIGTIQIQTTEKLSDNDLEVLDEYDKPDYYIKRLGKIYSILLGST